MNIEQKPVVNHGSRKNSKPVIIVNHISVGTMRSMYNTFNNAANQASSHFGVGRDGSIVQYVSLDRAAWTQGRIQAPTAQIVKQLLGNPNTYGVSIEHEGYAGNGVDGNLTDEQFYASCWLHKHIQEAVLAMYGVKIPLNSHQVLGHYQIDSIGKPACPGRNFPWARLYAELSIAETMTLADYAERLEYLKSGTADRATAYAFASRIADLSSKFNDPTWGTAAKAKIMWMEPIMYDLGYTGEPTPEGIANRVSSIYKNSTVDKYQGEAMRKLMLGAKFAKEKGLL
ncbi:hypothetical protein BBD42_13185 [Paenibacillus sp. BIHB 4019]|uniref:N-acetylmuramoyl-L-alanine amidase n=1 Tax=Paenibacillus sp. BIHB 4019 TaxID=1870819 RepID=A0A1B2DHX3_9BACL|nr:peptidoglycan recognition family protein [Paenibacillus sp. BIHB 4019]ANY67322.1 hypothetical protein BBD42_13185 [Paenibacillus sp. BIHB 4019]